LSYGRMPRSGSALRAATTTPVGRGEARRIIQRPCGRRCSPSPHRS